MNLHRATRWLAIGIVPVLVIALLGWLLLDFAAQRYGAVPLPAKSGSRLQYWIDPGGHLTQPQVAVASAENWRDWTDNTYVATRKSKTIWVRVFIRNDGDTPLHGVLENDDCFADRVDVWTTALAAPVHLLTGETVPSRLKAIPGREVAVPIGIEPHSEQTVLLRLHDYCGVYARFIWWPDATSFHAARTRAGLAEGIYFGGLVALLGYNIFLWLRLRQADIGFYVLYLAAVALFMMLARSQAPALGWPLGSPTLEKLLTVSMALAGGFLLQFSRVFLELEIHFPRFDAWMKRLAGVMLASTVVVVAMPEEYVHIGMRWSIGVTSLTHVGLLALVVAAWRAGVWQARFFALSFGWLFAGSLMMSGMWFGETLLRDTGMRVLMITSSLEMLLLSLAVADRFARTQQRLVEETEQRRMIEAAYADELEQEVMARTRELHDANVEKDRILAVIGHDLRGPLTGLMRSADNESGEFSRDVERTGRALLLMIEDLVLWTRLRAGTRTTSLHPATSLVMPAEALHHSLAGHGGVKLILDVPEDLRVETDLVLAQTLVRNLLANALKFARTQVVIRASAEVDGVHFMVGNDGPALSPAVLARLAIGEDEPMTATGGMGLKLCREICVSLGIFLEASSTGDGWTEFGFIIKSHSHPTG